MQDIPHKLKTYDNTANEYEYTINWDKTEILTNLTSKPYNDIVNKLPHPYNTIKLTKESKILGRLMTLHKNSNKNADFRLKKAKTAWNLIKYSSITNKNIDKTLRIYLFKAIIQSILTYSLHLFHISPSILSKLQAFYSMCIRKVYTGPRDPNTASMTSLDIRRKLKLQH